MEEASPMEIRQVRTIAGKLGYMGVSVPPLVSFAASFPQQSVSKMTVRILNMLNGAIRDNKKRIHEIQHPKPTGYEQEKAPILL